jgi:uncharacterized protein (TIGR03086 family)
MSAELLARGLASTQSVLARVAPEQLDAPTPCASWTVRDLINHIVGGTTFFAVTAETGGPFEGGGGDAPDFTTGDFVVAFAEGAARAVRAFSAEGAMEKTMRLPFGELPGSVFVSIAAGDTFAHGWDLAKATGQSTDLDPELAAELLANARTILNDSLRGPDGEAPFGPEREAPPGASSADRLAAFLGRQP